MQIFVLNTVFGETKAEIFSGDVLAKGVSVHHRAVPVMQQAENVIQIYAPVGPAPTLLENLL